MPLTRLNITDFRNLAVVKMKPAATGFNLLYGLNGSGKTSILEAVYYLSLGRSFRNTLSNRIIRHSCDKFNLFAHKLDDNDRTIPIGLERLAKGDLKIRIAGKDAQSTAELAQITPVQLINSQCYNLLDAGPAFRRKYLDWGAFYFHNEFFRTWREFVLILKQRNAALRQRLVKKDLEIWNQELVKKSADLDQHRRNYIELLVPLLNQTLAELIDLPNIEISYYPGWDKSQDYRDILSETYEKDCQFGYTQCGPHRADFRIKINKVSAKDILSRGQQKLFVCAMILAQGALMKQCNNKKPIYLIDDLPAELDIVSRTNLVTLLSKQETQIFVTAVECEALGAILSSPLPLKMFHVEHGSVMEVETVI